MIATDQGVRGFLHIVNDMLFFESSNLNLNSLQSADEIKEDRIDPVDLQKSIATFRKSTKLKDYVQNISNELAKFDWRTASTEGLSTAQRQKQMIYKGSSGYKEIRRELLKTLQNSSVKLIKDNASSIFKELGYAN